MNLICVFACIALLCSASAVIIRDDYRFTPTSLTTDYTQSYNSQSDSEADAYAEDELAKRRHHKRRRRPCASSKVEPLSGASDKTLINLYYTDSTNNYLGGGHGCGSSFSDDNSNRPHHGGNRPSRPGAFGTFLSNVLFGTNKPLSPAEDPVIDSDDTVVVGNSGNSGNSGPLGGSVPDDIKYNRYEDFNARRAYRQFNRELDRFLRPFYRLF